MTPDEPCEGQLEFADVTAMEPANRLPESSGDFLDDRNAMQSVVQGNSVGGFIPTPVSPIGQATARLELGSREVIEAELDAMMEQISTFWQMEPDEVMKIASALSARCTALAVLLYRVESTDRQYTRIRTLQVGPVLDELDRQFKLHSRMIEMRRQDLALLNGRD